MAYYPVSPNVVGPEGVIQYPCGVVQAERQKANHPRAAGPEAVRAGMYKRYRST